MAAATPAQQTTTSETYTVIPVTAPKVTVMQRSSILTLRDDASNRSSRSLYTVPQVEGIAQSDLSTLINSVTNLENDREKEKDQLRRTNNRLASFLEKSHFFDAANKLASRKLEAVRENVGKEAERIKDMYEAEIANVQRLLDDVAKARDEMEIKVKNMDAEVNALRTTHDEESKKESTLQETLDKQNRELVDAEGNWTMLRRKVEQATEERNKLKKENQQLRQAVGLARRDLQTLNLDRIQAESRAHALEEDIEFLKQKWENEKRELEKLAFQDPSTQNREFWKGEVQIMLKDLYDDFDNGLQAAKDELAAAHNVKLQEMMNERQRDNVEVARLKKDLNRLQSAKVDLKVKLDHMEPQAELFKKKLDDLKNDYEPRIKQLQDDVDKLNEQKGAASDQVKKLFDEVQKLLTANVKLEAEIARYRALLDQGEASLNKKDQKDQPADAAKPADAPKPAESAKQPKKPAESAM